MLLLFETSAGYALFKVLDESKLSETENLWKDLYKDFETPEKANAVVKLKAFTKFHDTTEALQAATALVEGKVGPKLKKMLKKLVVKEAQEVLAVADAKLGNAIKDTLKLNCVSNTAVHELMRCIRSQADGLLQVSNKELTAMSLGLAHSLSRYKLKFSPDKVDTMIVQAVSLLDDLDKELNNYIMRCKEWFGWHFPELSKIVTDNMAYVRCVKKMGMRTNAVDTDFADILPEEVAEEVKTAAEISMGTEISDEDKDHILDLCDQVIEISEYRAELYDYLKNRMLAIAPNVTALVGELVGARLVAHAGSLLNLAKHPASTVQILGAEKALFRALKTRHDTPKYGLIYHAQLVGSSSVKLRGKISRMLAAKTALAVRVDALGEDPTGSAALGVEHRAALERRVLALEQGVCGHRISGSKKFEKYTPKHELKQFHAAADSTIPTVAAATRRAEKVEAKPEPEEAEQETPKKKKKNKSKSLDESVENGENETAEEESVKKKKKRKGGAEEEPKDEEPPAPVPSAKKKKKKKSVSADD